MAPSAYAWVLDRSDIMTIMACSFMLNGPGLSVKVDPPMYGTRDGTVHSVMGSTHAAILPIGNAIRLQVNDQRFSEES